MALWEDSPLVGKKKSFGKRSKRLAYGLIHKGRSHPSGRRGLEFNDAGKNGQDRRVLDKTSEAL